MAERGAGFNGRGRRIEQFGADDDDPCRRVAKHELVVGRGPPRVQRHGNRADLDRAKKGRDHLRTVAHDQEHALFGAHVQRHLQRVADPVDLIEQVPITQPTIGTFDRGRRFTPLLDVAVDEVRGGVEHQRAGDRYFCGRTVVRFDTRLKKRNTFSICAAPRRIQNS